MKKGITVNGKPKLFGIGTEDEIKAMVNRFVKRGMIKRARPLTDKEQQAIKDQMKLMGD